MIWLSPEILEWPVDQGAMGTEEYAPETWRRPYEVWRHAERCSLALHSEFDRTDLILNLKKALDLRLKRLSELYPLGSKPPFIVDELVRLRVLRPVLVKKLRSIRNKLEHEDSPPPPRSYCIELLEFLWYFLRTTDPLVRRVIRGFQVSAPPGSGLDGGIFFGIDLVPEWQVDCDGQLPVALVSETSRDGWLELDGSVSPVFAEALQFEDEPPVPQEARQQLEGITKIKGRLAQPQQRWLERYIAVSLA